MQPVVVVVFALISAQHLRLLEVGEHLPVEQLVPQSAHERLRVGVLPRGAWLDVERPHPRGREVPLERLGDELGTVV